MANLNADQQRSWQHINDSYGIADTEVTLDDAVITTDEGDKILLNKDGDWEWMQ